MKTKVDKSFGSVVTVCCGWKHGQLRLAMSVTTVAFIGCTALVAGSAANNEATEALQYSASGWGCPFSYASNPCYSDACLEARNGGTMNQECCEEVSSYCGSSGDPACSGTHMPESYGRRHRGYFDGYYVPRSIPDDGVATVSTLIVLGGGLSYTCVQCLCACSSEPFQNSCVSCGLVRDQSVGGLESVHAGVETCFPSSNVALSTTSITPTSRTQPSLGDATPLASSR